MEQNQVSYDQEFDDIFKPAEPTLSRADVRQEVAKTLADISLYQSQQAAGVQHALEETASQLPDFRQQMPQMRGVLAETPVLRDAISHAESNPALQTLLPDLYRIAYRLSKSQSQDGSEQSGGPESPTPGGFSEEQIFMGTQSSKNIDLSAEKRQSLITELEKKGILDVGF